MVNDTTFFLWVKGQIHSWRIKKYDKKCYSQRNYSVLNI
jgi:hypothetical protein